MAVLSLARRSATKGRKPVRRGPAAALESWGGGHFRAPAGGERDWSEPAFEPDWSEPSFEPDWSQAAGLPSWALAQSVGSATVQAKLEVGAVDDPLEREADTVAERVAGRTGTPAALPAIPASGPGLRHGLDPRVQTARRGGDPLPPSTKALMEPELGHDLSGVRVHRDDAAAKLAGGPAAGARVQRQAAPSTSAACNPADKQGFPLIFDRWLAAPRPAINAVGYAQRKLNVFLRTARARARELAETHPKAAAFIGQMVSGMTAAKSPENPGDALDVDCKFGVNTTRATLAFQAATFPGASQSFSPEGQSKWDGRIGSITWPKLDAVSAGSESAPRPGGQEPKTGCTPADTDFGPSATNCAFYQSAMARRFLTFTYRQNATCACRETPNNPKNNCVRKCLQHKLAGFLGGLDKSGAAIGTCIDPIGLFDPACPEPFCTAIHQQHVDCFSRCCCEAAFINFPTFLTMCQFPFPCSFVGTTIELFNACL